MRVTTSILTTALLVACSPSPDDAEELEGAQNDDGSSGGAGVGGTDNAGGSLSGGGVGEPPVDCRGSFGAPSLLFQELGWIPQSLSPTDDELEFFYTRQQVSPTGDGERVLVMRSRASTDEAFSEPMPLSELDGVCPQALSGSEPASLDASGDGLRLYIGCHDMTTDEEGVLLLASRPDRSSPFALAAAQLGTVGISHGLSPDELEMYTSPSGDGSLPCLHYSRSSLSEVFSTGTPTTPPLPLTNPEPSPDGLELLGGMVAPGESFARLHRATRASPGEAFGAASTATMPAPDPNLGDYSPALSGDCRTLYFLRFDLSLREDGAQVLVAQRSE